MTATRVEARLLTDRLTVVNVQPVFWRRVSWIDVVHLDGDDRPQGLSTFD